MNEKVVCKDYHYRKKTVKPSEWDENIFESFIDILKGSTSQNMVKKHGKIQSMYYANLEVSCNKTESETTNISRVLTKSEIRNLYIEVLYTVKHKIGSSHSHNKHGFDNHGYTAPQLQVFAQRVFDISDAEHRSLLIAASEEKPPVVVVNICVIQAKDLEAKDADGFSDPYAMLGIIPGKLLTKSRDGNSDSGQYSDSSSKSRDKSPLRKFGRSFKKRLGGSGSEKHLTVTNPNNSNSSTTSEKDFSIPVKYIQTTSVVNNSLNPVWNELFHFEIESCSHDKLHLDIWDHDDEENVFDAVTKLNQIKGVKGLSRYFKQVGQSARNTSGDVDDFLGCVTIDLKDIPSTGIRKWYSLENRYSKGKGQGSVELDLKLGTRELRNSIEEDNWLDIQQHKELVKIFLMHEVNEHKSSLFNKTWNGTLRQEAEVILHQHAIQGDMTEFQILACRWLAYSEIFFESELAGECLQSLLKEMERNYSPGSLSRDEMNLLSNSYTEFLKNSLQKLGQFRINYQISEDQKGVDQLKTFLKIHYLIENSKLYKTISPFENDITTRICKVLKKSAVSLYSNQILGLSQILNEGEKDEVNSRLAQYLLLIQIINLDLHLIQSYYHEVFMREGQIDILQLTYKTYIKKIYEDFFHENSNENLTTFSNSFSFDNFDNYECLKNFQNFVNLYGNFQNFFSYQDYLVTNDFSNYENLDQQAWFEHVMHHWIQFMKHSLNKKIEYHIEKDELNVITDSHYLSSHSASIFLGSVDLIVHFWKRLNWSCIDSKTVLVTSLTEAIGSCGLLYSDALHEKTRLAGYFDEFGQFDLSMQVCISLNNINCIEKCLEKLTTKLDFNSLATELADTTGDKQKGKTILEALNALMKQNSEHITSVTLNIINRVTGKMRSEIRKNIYHLCWSPKSVHTEKACNDLIVYLEENVDLLRQKLHPANLTRFIQSIWYQVILQIQEQSSTEFNNNDNNDDNKEGSNDFNDMHNKLYILNRLNKCLDLIHEFLINSDESITEDMLNTQKYQDTKYLLTLFQLNPRNLIEYYFNEKLLQQENAPKDNRYGTLTIKTFYQRSSGILYLEIIEANKMVPLDSNGLSDPFVIIELAPPHYFCANNKPMKTKVIKNCLDPVFNEVFEIPIRLDQISKSSATLALTVMDHDLLMADDLEGVVFVNLNEVPGINREITRHCDIPSITLPLIMPFYESRKAMSILEKYCGDPEVKEILKKWGYIEKNLVNRDNV